MHFDFINTTRRKKGYQRKAGHFPQLKEHFRSPETEIPPPFLLLCIIRYALNVNIAPPLLLHRMGVEYMLLLQLVMLRQTTSALCYLSTIKCRCLFPTCWECAYQISLIFNPLFLCVMRFNFKLIENGYVLTNLFTKQTGYNEKLRTRNLQTRNTLAF